MEYALYLLACWPLAAFAWFDWTPFAVDQRVHMQLPAAPAEVDLATVPGASAAERHNTRLWTARDAEGVYQVARFAHMAVRPDTAGRRAYYRDVVDGALQREHGELLARGSFPTAAGDGLEFKYRARRRGTGTRVVKYSRSLVIGTTGYAFTFLPFDTQDSLGLAGNAARRRFFESITAQP